MVWLRRELKHPSICCLSGPSTALPGATNGTLSFQCGSRNLQQCRCRTRANHAISPANSTGCKDVPELAQATNPSRAFVESPVFRRDASLGHCRHRTTDEPHAPHRLFLL